MLNALPGLHAARTVVAALRLLHTTHSLVAGVMCTARGSSKNKSMLSETSLPALDLDSRDNMPSGFSFCSSVNRFLR